jgi:hypothetical protein
LEEELRKQLQTYRERLHAFQEKSLGSSNAENGNSIFIKTISIIFDLLKLFTFYFVKETVDNASTINNSDKNGSSLEVSIINHKRS